MDIGKNSIFAVFLALVLVLFSLKLGVLAAPQEDGANEPDTMTASVMPYEDPTYTGAPQVLLDESTLCAMASGIEIREPAIVYCAAQDGEYTAQQPEFTDAGTYTVYYRITADGYAPVCGQHTVTIRPKPASVVWTLAGDGFTRSGDTFLGAYTGVPFSEPSAVMDGEPVEIALCSCPDESRRTVGDYVFRALPGDNYALTDPVCTVRILGQETEGFALNGSPEVWYDASEHLPAELITGTPADAAVTYGWSDDGGATWKQTGLPQMPVFSRAGRYVLKAEIQKDGYEPVSLTADFRIKAAKYQVESFDFVTGWDIVLAYTNDEGVSFTYGGTQMFEVSDLGYRFGTTGSEGGRAYSFVYACLVHGIADQTKVVSSNAAAGDIGYTAGSPCDVNGSGSVDLYDLVAIQAVYNVNGEILEAHMETAIKADTNRDKKVDTNDAAYLKSDHE